MRTGGAINANNVSTRSKLETNLSFSVEISPRTTIFTRDFFFSIIIIFAIFFLNLIKLSTMNLWTVVYYRGLIGINNRIDYSWHEVKFIYHCSNFVLLIANWLGGQVSCF